MLAALLHLRCYLARRYQLLFQGTREWFLQMCLLLWPGSSLAALEAASSKVVWWMYQASGRSRGPRQCLWPAFAQDFPFVCEHLWMEMTFGPTERTYGTMAYRNIPDLMLSLGSWWEKNQQSSLLTFWPFYKDAFHKDDYLPRYRQSSVSKVGSSTGCGEIGCDCWELNTKAELWIQPGLCQQGNDLAESFYFNRLTDQEKTKELFFFFSKHLWLFSSFSSMIPLLSPYHWLK